MKRSWFIGVSLTTITVLIALHFATQGVAAPTASVPPRVIEYKVVALHAGDLADLQTILVPCGKEGWDLVTVYEGPQDHFAIFKR